MDGYLADIAAKVAEDGSFWKSWEGFFGMVNSWLSHWNVPPKDDDGTQMGGVVLQGVPTRVGEQPAGMIGRGGEEVFNPPVTGVVQPNWTLMGNAARGGGGGIEINLNIDGTGQDAYELIAEAKRQLEPWINEIAQEQHDRGQGWR
jgi:hypothetical protein